jgi:hypothetical protein
MLRALYSKLDFVGKGFEVILLCKRFFILFFKLRVCLILWESNLSYQAHRQSPIDQLTTNFIYLCILIFIVFNVTNLSCVYFNFPSLPYVFLKLFFMNSSTQTCYLSRIGNLSNFINQD